LVHFYSTVEKQSVSYLSEGNPQQVKAQPPQEIVISVLLLKPSGCVLLEQLDNFLEEKWSDHCQDCRQEHEQCSECKGRSK